MLDLPRPGTKRGHHLHEFGPVTDRIAHMGELIRDGVIAIDAERALNVTESYLKNLQVPPCHQTGKGHP